MGRFYRSLLRWEVVSVSLSRLESFLGAVILVGAIISIVVDRTGAVQLPDWAPTA